MFLEPRRKRAKLPFGPVAAILMVFACGLFLIIYGNYSKEQKLAETYGLETDVAATITTLAHSYEATAVLRLTELARQPLTPIEGGPLATIKADILNIRAGPGTEYEVVGKVPRGAEVPVLARNEAGDWLLIARPDGGQGWIAAQYAEVSVDIFSLQVAAEISPSPAVPP
jgi:uncharacterized protein YgiM (DUF1202 family)